MVKFDEFIFREIQLINLLSLMDLIYYQPSNISVLLYGLLCIFLKVFTLPNARCFLSMHCK